MCRMSPRMHIRGTVLGLVLFAVGAGALGQVDLGDIAVGGDGSGSAVPGLGLRCSDGHIIGPDAWGGQSGGGPVFVPTDGTGGAADLPFVDGVFVPDGATPVDTQGTSFAFPNTNSYYYDCVRNAYATYDPTGHPVPGLQALRLPDQPGLDRRGLGIHSNGGITFDLGALRTAGYQFISATGVAGIDEQSVGTVGRFETWILVDGAVRYHREFAGMGLTHEGFSIPLASTDQRLTFAVTDFNGVQTSDHGCFADAILFIPEPTACGMLLVVLSVGIRLRRR